MKKLITLLIALCMAATAAAAPKKDEKKDPKKETPPMMWSVVIEGAAEASEAEVKAMLAGVKDLRVESIAKTEGTIEAVVSSNKRFSRADISRAIKENKALKVKEFKTKKPEKEGDSADKEGDKKTGDKKEMENKATDNKDGGKPAGDAQKIIASKKITKMKANIGSLVGYIVTFSVENRGNPPSQAAGLRVLITKRILVTDDLLTDPWGEAVEYKVPATRSKDKFDVWSKGPDKISGNEDDIGNWKSGD
jgi:hypothetical protein